MPTYCCVCQNKYTMKKGVSFFCFPKDSMMRLRWVKKISEVISDFHVASYTSDRVCSDHFLDTQIVKNKHRIRLLKTAMPLLFNTNSPACSVPSVPCHESHDASGEGQIANEECMKLLEDFELVTNADTPRERKLKHDLRLSRKRNEKQAKLLHAKGMRCHRLKKKVFSLKSLIAKLEAKLLLYTDIDNILENNTENMEAICKRMGSSAQAPDQLAESVNSVAGIEDIFIKEEPVDDVLDELLQSKPLSVDAQPAGHLPCKIELDGIPSSQSARMDRLNETLMTASPTKREVYLKRLEECLQNLENTTES